MTDQSEYVTYFNGEWIPHGEVSISPDDRGFTLSDVVFDIARTFDGLSGWRTTSTGSIAACGISESTPALLSRR